MESKGKNVEGLCYTCCFFNVPNQNNSRCSELNQIIKSPGRIKKCNHYSRIRNDLRPNVDVLST